MRNHRQARAFFEVLLILLSTVLFSCGSTARIRSQDIQSSATRIIDADQIHSSDEARISSQAEVFLADLAKQRLFSGSVLIARNGIELLSNGWGLANRDLGIPNTSETKYRIGSITKQFTATAIMLLQKQGKLMIQDLISNYIRDIPEAWKSITIYHLLTHTSGIHNITSTLRYLEQKKHPITPDGLVDLIRSLPMDFLPGAKYSYSNSGYMILGKIIEVVSGESYEKFLSDTIFSPLSMANTGYDSSEKTLPNRAAGYTINGAAPDFIDMSFPYAAGGLYSTVKDLFAWDQALYSDSILPQQMIDEMMSPHVSVQKDVTSYGFGWVVAKMFDRRFISHGGGIDGFTGEIDRYIDDRVTIIVLSNVENSNVGDVSNALARIIFNK